MTDLPELPFNKISLPKKDAVKMANRSQHIGFGHSNQQLKPIRFKNYPSKVQATKFRPQQLDLNPLEEIDEYCSQTGGRGLHDLYRQKKKVLSDIKKSVNQNKFYAQRQKQLQKVYRSLEMKQDRAMKARKQRKLQRQKNQKTKIQLREQEMRQKINLKATIQDSKASLLCSRIAMKSEKFVKAQSLRQSIFQEQNQIQKQKLFSLQKKRQFFHKVKSEEKSVKDYIQKLSEDKIEKAKYRRKLQIHTLAIEKQQIESMSRSVKSELSQSITKFKFRIDTYKNRIQQMRKKLGHTRVQSGLQLKRSKPSFTETSDEFEQKNRSNQISSDDQFQQQ